MKTTRYILLDPATATATEVNLGGITATKGRLRCAFPERVAFYGPQNGRAPLWALCLFFDAQGAANGRGRQEGGLNFADHPAPIMGPLLLSGPMERGRETDCPLSVDEARGLVRWIHRDAFARERVRR